MAKDKLKEMIDRCIIEESYSAEISDKDWKRMNKNLSRITTGLNLITM